jgi:hypothetical protein
MGTRDVKILCFKVLVYKFLRDMLKRYEPNADFNVCNNIYKGKRKKPEICGDI